MIAIDLLHPQQQAQSRGAGTRIFIDDPPFLRPLDQLFQALRWISQFVFVIDEGEIAIVVGNKGVIIPAARHADRAGGYVAFGKQFTLRRGFQQVVIKAKHDVGLAVFAFHAQAIQ